MKKHSVVDRDSDSSEAGQMLLAAGMVLLMSLLSMAVYGVKLAGLGTPHDSTEDALIDVAKELQRDFSPLLEQRTLNRIDAGMDWQEAAESALSATHDDLLHHGEIRGVEIKMLQMNVSNVSGQLTLTAVAGLSDSKAMLEIPLSAEFTVQ
ncbi:MAG: hypothetical protein QF707_05035 [Candidatus Poseidoniaceae archaeon]|jgi:hypothetical protein|nr:hypothetical protein [Candidatus Poseidoniaceae archaeon]MDP7202653.1 hypothetical protein [Candidatus Poseidoniaceae archaeon]